MTNYDPFLRGRFPVGVCTIQAPDSARNRRFPCEMWYPALPRYADQDLSPETCDGFTVPGSDQPRTQLAVRDAEAKSGPHPLILFSHSSGGGRRQSTFLCTHLSSHGYVVAAMDHSELVAPELARKNEETPEQKAARIEAFIANRTPDIRFLLDHLLNPVFTSKFALDHTRIGIVGHSFGGWTALAAVEAERRIRAVVALAPGGSSLRKPGILPLTLTFQWDRPVPALYLVAENDVSLPLAGMYELFGRAPSTKQMLILRRADHLHFMDNVEQLHEAVRAMPLTGELAWIQKEMRPVSELCSAEQAHLFVRGLTVCHFDATLREQQEAQQFLSSDVASALAAHGVDAIAYKPEPATLAT